MITVLNLLHEMGFHKPNQFIRKAAGRKIAAIYRSQGQVSETIEQYENGFRYDVAAYPDEFKITMENAIHSLFETPQIIRQKIRKMQKGLCANCGTRLSLKKKSWDIKDGKAIHHYCPGVKIAPAESIKQVPAAKPKRKRIMVPEKVVSTKIGEN